MLSISSGDTIDGGGKIPRRLAAILAADVAGSSRLIGADEEGTLAALKELRRDLADPKIKEHRGRIVKTPVMAYLSSLPACRCGALRRRGSARDGLTEC